MTYRRTPDSRAVAIPIAAVDADDLRQARAWYLGSLILGAFLGVLQWSWFWHAVWSWLS